MALGTSPEADLQGAPGSDSDDSAIRRFGPLFRVPLGSPSGCRTAADHQVIDRAARAAQPPLEVDRLRRTISQERSMRIDEPRLNEPTGSTAERSMRPYRCSLSGGSRWSEGGHSRQSVEPLSTLR